MSEETKVDATDLLLAGILLNRREPLSPHHIGWIREKLGHPTDEELSDMVRTGKYHKRTIPTTPDAGRPTPETGIATARRRMTESFRDCVDCVHNGTMKTERCRKCWEDPARPSWANSLAFPSPNVGCCPHGTTQGCELCDLKRERDAALADYRREVGRADKMQMLFRRADNERAAAIEERDAARDLLWDFVGQSRRADGSLPTVAEMVDYRAATHQALMDANRRADRAESDLGNARYAAQEANRREIRSYNSESDAEAALAVRDHAMRTFGCHCDLEQIAGGHRNGCPMALGYAPGGAEAALENLTYSSTQATTCEVCGIRKHTPLRVDSMGGYVCLMCVAAKLHDDAQRADKAEAALTEATARLADWDNAVAHVEADHPDEHHCGCVPVLRGMLAVREHAMRTFGCLCDLEQIAGGHRNGCPMALGYADAAQAEMRAAQRWIPVTERLPDKEQRVLAYFDYAPSGMRLRTVVYDWGGRWLDCQIGVAHPNCWQPLPPAPDAVGERATDNAAGDAAEGGGE